MIPRRRRSQVSKSADREGAHQRESGGPCRAPAHCAHSLPVASSPGVVSSAAPPYAARMCKVCMPAGVQPCSPALRVPLATTRTFESQRLPGGNPQRGGRAVACAHGWIILEQHRSLRRLRWFYGVTERKLQLEQEAKAMRARLRSQWQPRRDGVRGRRPPSSACRRLKVM